VGENQWASASGQLVADAYLREADGFGAIAARPAFRRMLLSFTDYEAHLCQINKDSIHQEKIRKLLQVGATLDTSKPTPELVEIFCEAQIAVCCELFRGKNISASQMNREGMRLLARQAASKVIDIPAIAEELSPADYSESQKDLLDALNHVGNLDTLRVMQVTRSLGLIAVRPDSVRQLSLGAGNGYRDLYGIHAVPKITIQSLSKGDVFAFNVIDRVTANTVLIDNDPMLARHYDKLNADQGGKILAMNMDANRALQELQNKQQDLGLGSRNLVAGLRIDHRMIPDAGEFLRLISAVIDSSADMLLTIGAGNNLAEFESRIRCFDALSKLLKSRGMEPIRIKLHGPGSSNDQRRLLNFGNLEYASYQILYCELLRKKL
tara:strand:- start:2332 stop:3471 length:1140 start_codon:yes stop_codon:yes gene_type:complete